MGFLSLRVFILVKVNELASGLSGRLTRWTGKSPIPIHPKHLVTNPEHNWYLAYIEKPHRVADLGCGNGIHSLNVVQKGTILIGFENDRTSLEHCQKLRTHETGGHVLFVHLDLEHGMFPLRNGWADCVLLLDVLEHLHNRQTVLGEASRILKSDGRLLMAVPNRQTRFKKLKSKAGLSPYADRTHVIEYSPSTLNEELRQAGFRILETRPIVIDTPLYGLIDLVGGVNLTFYKRLVEWKIAQARKYPDETTGWRLVCEKI